MLKPLQASRIKKNKGEGVGYQLTKNVGRCGSLIKKNCQLKSSSIFLTFVGLADVSLHYDSVSL